MIKKRIGQMAENEACRFLRQKGYKILQRNFRCRLGELDIIANDKNDFVILEVRSSASSFLSDPLESISYTKIRRLKTLASIWLFNNRLDNVSVRFDVVSVVFRNGIEIKHIIDAF
jgi:putative endonuclease